MKLTNIASVSYINSYPFIYGIEHSNELKNKYKLCLCPPSDCAEHFINNMADVALIPTAAIPNITAPFEIISDYCIGATTSVKTVILFSNTDIKNIKKIIIDSESITSHKLLKLLAKSFWQIEPEYERQHIAKKPDKNDAILAIGDKCFSLDGSYKYQYDLFDSWHSFTGLPFVFAVWVARSSLEKSFIHDFNEGLKFGLNNKHSALKQYLQNDDGYLLSKYHSYLNTNISYNFDNDKKKAFRCFLKMLKDYGL